jgi:Fe-S-cluster containining protein
MSEIKLPCENCPAKLDKSKIHCCGLIPFPIKFLEDNKKFFQENGNLNQNGEQGVIITPDERCVFLNRETFECAIYEKRPFVCKIFGEKALPCYYYKPSGNKRSPASEKVTMRELKKRVMK